jgi:ERCC4-type nuclease
VEGVSRLGVVLELEKLGKIVVKIEHLSLGDYCIDGAVLIERKTAADFAQSLIDGQPSGQAGRMAASSMRPAYILGGSSAEWFGLGVSREALQGALVTLMLIFDVPVFRSSDPAESARLILYIGSQLVPPARLRVCALPAGQSEAEEESATSRLAEPARCWAGSRKAVA